MTFADHPIPFRFNMKLTAIILAALALAPVSRGAEPEAKAAPVMEAKVPRAATPQPKTERPGWMAQHDALTAQARKGNIDLLFMGDSLTKCWSREGRDVWAAKFAKLGARNFGISGDCTQHLLWRIQNGELENIKPKAVVLLIGTNNISMGDSPQDIAVAVAAILGEIHRRLPDSRILLLGVLPRKENADHRDRETIRTLNGLLSRLQNGNHVTYLDFGDKLLQPNGSMPKEVTTDFTHLTAKGYGIFAQAIEPVLIPLFAKP